MLQAALPVHTILELAAAVAAAALVWRLIAVRRREMALIAASAINEESLQRTIDDAPIGLAMVGLDGSWLRVNAAICELVGSPADALLKLTFQDITHPEDLATDLGLVQQTIRGEIPGYTMEKRYLHRDGRVVPVELHVSIVRTADSQPLHFIAQIVDLTRRAAAERALRRQEAAFAALVEEADDVIIRYDTNHRIRSANPATTRGNRIDSPSLIGRRVDELGIDSELAERWNAVLARVIATGESEKFEYSFPHPDGSAREWQVRFTAERGGDGRASGVFAVSRDITDLQKANAALRQREQELVALMEGADDIIVRYDLEYRIRYVNSAITRATGLPQSHFIGKTNGEAGMPPDLVELGNGAMAQVLASGRPATVDFDYPGVDGPRHFLSQLSVIKSKQGDPSSVLVISCDFTQRRKLELERERLLEQLTRSQAAIKTLKGLLPTCAWCHKIRDENGEWEQMESYISRHTDAEFNHGLCPVCAATMLKQE